MAVFDVLSCCLSSGVQKTIQLLFTNPAISHTFGNHTRPLHEFLTWARKLGVSVECRLKDPQSAPLTVDCSEEVSSASPAVTGPVAEVVQQLATQADKVTRQSIQEMNGGFIHVVCVLGVCRVRWHASP